MAALTPEQRQKKWEEIALHNIFVQLNHMRENHQCLRQGADTIQSIIFYLRETRRALDSFEESMTTNRWNEDFEDLGEPKLL